MPKKKKAKEEEVFRPQDYETYREYMGRLKDEKVYSASMAASMMALMMVQGGQSGNTMVDKTRFLDLRKKLMKEPALTEMMKDRKKVREMIKAGDAVGMISLMADKETERQRQFDRYKVPDKDAKNEAVFLKNAIESLKKHAPKDEAAGTASPENEKRSKYYHEMMKRLEEAQTKAESGVTISGEKTKELIGAIMAYNDGGDKLHRGGQERAEGFTEAMCLLHHYTGTTSFSKYCQQMNEDHEVRDPANPMYVEPNLFPAARLDGSAKTAREWLAENRERLMNSPSLEGYAQAAAIQQLSRGNPNAIIWETNLDAATRGFQKPGSSFMRAMEEMGKEKPGPKTQTTLDKFKDLAAMGEAAEIGDEILKDCRKRAARAAQHKLNTAVRNLTHGPLNAYTAAENLAMVLAARQVALHGGGGTGINNGAFNRRVEQLQKDPAFQALAERYTNDPSFRRSMNRSLQQNSSGAKLDEELRKSNKTLTRKLDETTRALGDEMNKTATPLRRDRRDLSEKLGQWEKRQQQRQERMYEEHPELAPGLSGFR